MIESNGLSETVKPRENENGNLDSILRNVRDDFEPGKVEARTDNGREKRIALYKKEFDVNGLSVEKDVDIVRTQFQLVLESLKRSA